MGVEGGCFRDEASACVEAKSGEELFEDLAVAVNLNTDFWVRSVSLKPQPNSLWGIGS
jgi:hypothetical protein